MRVERHAPQTLHEELHERVTSARGGITLLDDLNGVGIDLEAIYFGDRCFIDAGEGDALLIRRPPVTGGTIHLFLRDELRRSEADQTAALFRDRPLRRVREVVDDE